MPTRDGPSPSNRISAKVHRTGRRKGARNQGFEARGKWTTAAAINCRANRPGVSDCGAYGHRRRLHVGDGRVRGFLEHHRLPACSLGDELAQQEVVQLVARLVAAELADEAVA